MSTFIKKFGNVVLKRVEDNPQSALSLLRFAYNVNGIQLKYFPKKGLLPYENYGGYVCNDVMVRAECGGCKFVFAL